MQLTIELGVDRFPNVNLSCFSCHEADEACPLLSFMSLLSTNQLWEPRTVLMGAMVVVRGVEHGESFIYAHGRRHGEETKLHPDSGQGIRRAAFPGAQGHETRSCDTRVPELTPAMLTLPKPRHSDLDRVPDSSFSLLFPSDDPGRKDGDQDYAGGYLGCS